VNTFPAPGFGAYGVGRDSFNCPLNQYSSDLVGDLFARNRPKRQLICSLLRAASTPLDQQEQRNYKSNAADYADQGLVVHSRSPFTVIAAIGCSF